MIIFMATLACGLCAPESVAKKTHKAAGFLLGPLNISLIFWGPQVGKNPENPRFSWLMRLIWHSFLCGSSEIILLLCLCAVPCSPSDFGHSGPVARGPYKLVREFGHWGWGDGRRKRKFHST